MLYLENMEQISFNTYPYIFEPIVRIVQVLLHSSVYDSGQSIEMIEFRFHLGHQLSYYISPVFYVNGNNIASNFIAEMAEFGCFGVVIFSTIICYLMLVIDKKVCTNDFVAYMSFLLCGWIFLMPRAEAFFDTYTLFKYWLIYIVLQLFSIELSTKPDARQKVDNIYHIGKGKAIT